MSTPNLRPSPSFFEAALRPGTQGAFSGTIQSLKSGLDRLFCHSCPSCGKRALACCYVVPEAYREASPRYYRCVSCTNHYMRMFTGPWLPISAAECPRGGASASTAK